MPDRDYLFVYGTLRKSPQGRSHAFLAGRTDYIGLATLPGLLYRVTCYPAAITGGEGLIHGEVYLLHEPGRTLPTLDDYEECSAAFPEPREYRRCKTLVRLAGGRRLPAWTYFYNWPVAGLERIASGDFLNP